MLLQKCTMYNKGCLIPSNAGKGFGKNGNNRVMPQCIAVVVQFYLWYNLFLN